MFKLYTDIPEYATILETLVTKTRDKFREANCTQAIIGFSAGKDSLLTTLIAMEALGKDNVHLLSMSSENTTKETEDLTKEFFSLLNHYYKMNISDINEIIVKKLRFGFNNTTNSAAKQNVQARIRGLLLMSLSNLISNSLVLATGNKTEAKLGYCTIYGDTVGAFSIIGDLYATEVKDLLNNIEVKTDETNQYILNNTIKKITNRAPSAELFPNQTDESDFGFSYEEIDSVLRLLEKKKENKTMNFVLGTIKKNEQILLRPPGY